MINSVKYSFTITLRPKCFTKEPECQYDDTYEYVRRKLSSLSQAFTLIVEKTKAYNIHMHGVIQFIISNNKFDCMKEFHKCFRNDSIIGFVNIKQMTDEQGWIKYMKKDLVSTLNSINRRPLIWDYFDYFDSEERATFGVTW